MASAQQGVGSEKPGGGLPLVRSTNFCGASLTSLHLNTRGAFQPHLDSAGHLAELHLEPHLEPAPFPPADTSRTGMGSCARLTLCVA